MLAAGSVLADEPPPKGTLSGKVVGPDGEPVARARVWGEQYGGTILVEARTGDDGRFRLGPIEPAHRSRFDLFVDADGLARQYVLAGTYSIYPGIDSDLGTIPLERGRVFTGRVLDEDGMPQPEATLECTVYRYLMGHTVDSIGPAPRVTTDAEGRFRTPPLPVGRLSLQIRAPGRQLALVSRAIEPVGEESLGPIRLEPDAPISGVLRDDLGRPIAGAKVRANAEVQTISDASGAFTLRGFGPSARFQLQVDKDGFVLINRDVTVVDGEVRWHDVGGDRTEHGPDRDLSLTMEPVAWIEGRAVDAETGEPVRLERVVLCFFARKPDGEVVLSGCRDGGFEQPEPGRFRVAYMTPDEYHLTFSAEGYHDAEAFTPKVETLEPIGGITVRLRKASEGTRGDVAERRIVGTVTRDGRPVEGGWVGLWARRRLQVAVNAPIQRGRVVDADPIPYASAPIRDGAYALDVPFQGEGWYVVVDQPGHPLTQVGPLSIAREEEKTLDIACAEGGRIRGRVEGIPAAWQGHAWVVAFTRTGIRAETRADAEGAFAFPPLPPGEYGLKAGHDAFEDPEVPRRSGNQGYTDEEWTRSAAPWANATRATIEAGRDPAMAVVAWPR